MEHDGLQEQIGRILKSKAFDGKSQVKRLLEILFEHMDSQSTLKPDRVIKELWQNDAKTKGSPDLATEKNRLRRALEVYYSSEGKDDPILISLPNRTTAGPDGAKERRWIAAEPREVIPKTEAEKTREHGPRNWFWVAVCCTLIGALALFALRRMFANDPPSEGRLDSSTLTILDGEGKQLWQKIFPDGLKADYYSQGVATRLWFGDLKGDGRTEVLFLYEPPDNPNSHSTTLICYSERGKELWRWTPGRVLPELGGSPSTFKTVAFGVLQATPSQRRRIVVSSYHEVYYPHQIAVLDANGKALSEYWHSGHLDYLALGQVGRGSGEKIVATGIANGYHQATMVVLDPDHASGASLEAVRPEIQLHGFPDPTEELRLLFPRSDLNQSLAVYNMGQAVMIDHGMVRFSVLECDLLPRCQIWYEFDRNLHLRSAEADDQFRSAHKEFYLKSKQDHPFTPFEESAFQKIQCLAGCTTGLLPVQGR